MDGLPLRLRTLWNGWGVHASVPDPSRRNAGAAPGEQRKTLWCPQLTGFNDTEQAKRDPYQRQGRRHLRLRRKCYETLWESPTDRLLRHRTLPEISNSPPSTHHPPRYQTEKGVLELLMIQLFQLLRNLVQYLLLDPPVGLGEYFRKGWFRWVAVGCLPRRMQRLLYWSLQE